MIITPDSHLDHDLTSAHLQYLFKLYGDRREFFIETIDLPSRLPMLQCNLYGPVMGDPPVPDHQAVWMPRMDRPYPSRLFCEPGAMDLTRPQGPYSGRQPRPTRQLTIIAGPHLEHACILYTAFGGPLAPKEPGDPTLSPDKRAESVEFWAQHALVR